MSAHFFIVALLSSIVIPSVQEQSPKLDMTESPVFFGTINGSPVLTVFHGPSDVLKEDIQNKDTEEDPLLEKMGPRME
ncbi:hypothetical protein GCK32_000904 [Trichostrongylus colubriformis]|uniref:Uncharacterized protein n=1 Tax=Trichostrongylus colubriformis TaxID=6319 RepID=A0AAN8EZ18_TRICO